ncbi:hypothetical protein EVG20_g6122 [Dentipellis fragilis]|uniref:Uncharacterized protein n=1 Tax=Dentipellis fragilis TaxID=205917 RepID=A0A4Y9YNF4_9AGAM|nr:hypothetical protein EVG20_g6122 [Dentipellis fragilis]
MIIDKDKTPFPDDPTPTEAPPSYAYALRGSSTSLATTSYSAPKFTPPRQSPPRASSSFPTALGSLGSRKSSKSSSKSKGKASARWFSFGGLSKNAKQVHATVQGLVRELVKQSPSSEFASVLASCAEACDAQGLGFSSILQDPFIEGHLPVYWAILKRPAEVAKAPTQVPGIELEGDAFVMALLAASSPMSAQTIAEVRLACVLNSDHGLFQRIRRRFRPFAPLSGTDEMLLSDRGVEVAGACDLVTVEEIRGDVGAFVASFDIILFQLRMRVSKTVKIEFIARGRLWYILFRTAPPNTNGHRAGSWLVTLGLTDNSSPTHLDSRLLIEDAGESRPSLEHPPSAPGVPHTPASPSLTPRISLPSIPLLSVPPPPQHPSRRSSHSKKPRPTISLRIKTGSKMLAPPVLPSSAPSEITVSLEESLLGASLQYENSSYIDSEGTLKARLEARLAKPDSDCIIC